MEYVQIMGEDFLGVNCAPPQCLDLGDGFVVISGSVIDCIDQPVQTEPEDEIKSHILDHMYAKKPREPGTELVKPTRRRSKKKEQLMNQLFIQELAPEAPRINIIRQRLPISPAFRPVPKILYGGSGSSAPKLDPPNVSVPPVSIVHTMKSRQQQIRLPIPTKNGIGTSFSPSPITLAPIDELDMCPPLAMSDQIPVKKQKQNNTTSYFGDEVIVGIQDSSEEEEFILDLPIEEAEQIPFDVDVFDDMVLQANPGCSLIASDVLIGLNGTDTLNFSTLNAAPSSMNSFGKPQLRFSNRALSSSEILPIELSESLCNDGKHQESQGFSFDESISPDSIVVNQDVDIKPDLLQLSSPEPTNKPSLITTPTRRSTRPTRIPNRLKDLGELKIKRRRL